ncbi:lanthionine synthetase LanC family protein [Undibacterium cyanobacteriorum]|uniref:Lanthionine synthetase LanC family protein n=1 Tax=Undibacterium cyanobacteriorum TaxID=3073561 RepID=A0ABY9RG15_9BURK|nr:lanthionine synthetase LanC family protein [Undibacterium sp. 20NA77.5]WMW79798.1 lanthionine synthetase LanC family protein [Undibacterium sp. 20NA77.5]
MIELREKYLEVAQAIAIDICRDAFWAGNACTWLGWAINKVQRSWPKVFRSLEAELYGGSSGILLFLAEVNRICPDPLLMHTIEGALNQVLASCRQPELSQRYGFYVGRAGNAYVMWRVGCLLGRSDWVEHGMREFRSLRELPPDSHNLDVISGSAGTILALLQCARVSGDESLVDIAVMHAMSLANHAERQGDTVSWKTIEVDGQQNLTGYSHGAAGIAVALQEIHTVTQDKSWLELIDGALNYERANFDHNNGNWFDLRLMPGESAETKKPSCFMAWCHGAPGIGLARLRQLQLFPNKSEVHEDLRLAIEATQVALRKGWQEGQDNFSLCHGYAGNADFLLQAGIVLQREDLVHIAQSVGDTGIREILKQGLPWPCGNGGAGETPNLMLGTAGIGYFYLRLYSPETVPSVLLISS